MPTIYNEMSVHLGDAPVDAKVTEYSTFATLELEVGGTTVRLYVKTAEDVTKIAAAILHAAAYKRVVG